MEKPITKANESTRAEAVTRAFVEKATRTNLLQRTSTAARSTATWIYITTSVLNVDASQSTTKLMNAAQSIGDAPTKRQQLWQIRHVKPLTTTLCTNAPSEPSK